MLSSVTYYENALSIEGIFLCSDQNVQAASFIKSLPDVLNCAQSSSIMTIFVQCAAPALFVMPVFESLVEEVANQVNASTESECEPLILLTVKLLAPI